ncbi:hypothetical protein FKM82_020445 [Ascaphus truei]
MGGGLGEVRGACVCGEGDRRGVGAQVTGHMLSQSLCCFSLSWRADLRIVKRRGTGGSPCTDFLRGPSQVSLYKMCVSRCPRWRSPRTPSSSVRCSAVGICKCQSSGIVGTSPCASECKSAAERRRTCERRDPVSVC